MSLLNDIEEAAVDSRTDLADILRRCKLLAARFGYEPFAEWVEKELNGYPTKEGLPDYRIVPVESRGDFVGAVILYKSMVMPTSLLPKEYQEFATKSHLTDGIATYGYLATEGVERGIKSNWPGDMVAKIGTTIYRGYNCIEAWRDLSSAALVRLLDTVRNRILSFVLEIEKMNPGVGEAQPGTESIPRPQLTQVFNTVIMGEANILDSDLKLTHLSGGKVTHPLGSQRMVLCG